MNFDLQRLKDLKTRSITLPPWWSCCDVHGTQVQGQIKINTATTSITALMLRKTSRKLSNIHHRLPHSLRHNPQKWLSTIRTVLICPTPLCPKGTWRLTLCGSSSCGNSSWKVWTSSSPTPYGPSPMQTAMKLRSFTKSSSPKSATWKAWFKYLDSPSGTECIGVPREETRFLSNVSLLRLKLLGNLGTLRIVVWLWVLLASVLGVFVWSGGMKMMRLQLKWIKRRESFGSRVVHAASTMMWTGWLALMIERSVSLFHACSLLMPTAPVLGAEDDFDIRVWRFDSLLHVLRLMLYFWCWFCLRLSCVFFKILFFTDANMLACSLQWKVSREV